MKHIRTTICLLLPPLFLLAQDDYCPCMDSYSYEDEFEGMMSSVNMTFTEFSYEQKASHIHVQNKEDVPFFEIETEEEIKEKSLEKEEGFKKEKTESKNKISQKKSRKGFQKGKKWRIKGKKRRARKFKKYRGQCPMF